MAYTDYLHAPTDPRVDLRTPVSWDDDPLTALKKRQLRARDQYVKANPMGSASDYYTRQDALRDLDDRDMQEQQQLLHGALASEIPYTADEKRVAARKVQAFRDQADRSMPGSSSTFAGTFAPFFQFHEDQAALAQGRGVGYQASLPGGGGGGGGNSRASAQAPPSTGDTYGVYSSAADPSTLPSSRRGTAMAGPGAAGTPSPYDLLIDPYLAADPNSAGVKLAQMAAMDALRNSVDAGNRARAKPWEGDANDYNRTDMQAAQARRNTGLDAEAGSDVAAGNYWRNQNPIDMFKHDVGQTDLDAANSRALNIEGVRKDTAIQKALLAFQGATTKQDQAVAMAQLKALVSRANVGSQYGQDTSALDSAISGMTGVGTPQGTANIRQPMGAPAAGQPEPPDFPGKTPGQKLRDPDTGMVWQWSGQGWAPLGGR